MVMLALTIGRRSGRARFHIRRLPSPGRDLRPAYRDVLRVFQERRLPVIWVGAPPMRGGAGSANDLVRDRQRAGAILWTSARFR